MRFGWFWRLQVDKALADGAWHAMPWDGMHATAEADVAAGRAERRWNATHERTEYRLKQRETAP
jgi:hypothetical protein